jgi:hypothetical protein
VAIRWRRTSYKQSELENLLREKGIVDDRALAAKMRELGEPD